MMMLMMISHYYRRGFPPRMCGQVAMAMANKQMVLDTNFAILLWHILDA